MVNLVSYFKILFMLAEISEASVVRFFEDHLQRLIANNPGGKYTPLITALTSLLSTYKTSIDQRNLNQALQESETMTVDQFIAEFKALVSRKEGVIADIWDPADPIYQKFYPHGLDEYNRANKGNVVGFMTRFISACDLHREDLPDGFVTPFSILKTKYEPSRTSQLTLIGNTDGNRLNVIQKREAVAVQVTKNLLAIASDNLGHPEMVNVYFDQSIIRRPQHQNGAEPIPDVLDGVVAPESKVVVLHGGFDANTSFHVVNTGSVIIKIYTANLPDDVVPSNARELAPGEEDDVLGSQLGADGNLFLMAYNPDKTAAGSYEVSIGEEI